ncbi:hypothetical protein [Celerinatantimonas sp. YJH-8]|uniref:hypothetical protein n=1 Tax=Celerinatantimonas sp. YJH-8 TaxID=3228714 RepID=UPI0038C8DDDB
MELRSVALLQHMGITVWEPRVSPNDDTYIVVCDHPDELQQTPLWLAISAAMTAYEVHFCYRGPEQFCAEWASRTLWLSARQPDISSESFFFVGAFHDLRQQARLKQQLWKCWSHV